MRVVVCGSSNSPRSNPLDLRASGAPGAGNIRSVVRALERATIDAGGAFDIRVSGEPADVASADYVVVPGQGAFGPFARGIEGGLGDALREHIAKERPYLGICLGLQVLFESSDEAPGASGLGILRGHVKRLAPGIDPATSRTYALPHIGWNSVVSPMQATAGERFFYFAHTFAAEPADASVISGTTEYGAARFASAIRHGAITGVQFHPEKSQREGLALLTAFFRPSADHEAGHG
ncbi:MAG: Imidazole glycerol phosphate synthase amidotransferase subunit [Myxococcaceae bacterium]|nr:Imidazole glycerol phosphate synthase amidotransferase subunit [Myxococcaceae bacterium]MEA2746296.1 imidazole glycerol-phosphate synthase subunit HisH [Myxococcales bacterium]